MREKFSGRRSGLARMLSASRGAGARAGGAGRAGGGRIRYAHGGPPRIEPYCTAARGPAAWHRDAVEGTGDVAGGDTWQAGPPVGGRHGDLWVLIGGGIAATAAFAAAFVASGGMATHPATPGATMPAVVSQACPAPAAAPTPHAHASRAGGIGN